MRESAHGILTEARQTRQHYQVTGTDFDKIKANMYSIFECYAHGLITWDQVKTRFKTSIREYISLYKGTKYLKEEIKIMNQEYKNVLRNYKPALDAYRVVSEQKLTANLVAKKNLNESVAKQHSNTYYNNRVLSENDLTDTTRLTWKRVMEAYPNLTTKDEDRVRMLTIFEGPTLDTTQMITTVMKEEPTSISGPMQTSMRPKLRPGRYDDPDQWFNPSAGHRDQPSHPENRGLTDNPSSAPATSPRPRLRPSNLGQRAAIDRAVRTAMGEGWKELPPIDRDRYQERDGLEGPFSTLSGKVVYYDPKEGAYYDPDTDMYLSYDEFKELDNDRRGMKEQTEKRWKQTSMSPEAAAKEFGKENVRVKKGALRNGDDMVEVFTEDMSDNEIDAFHRALDALVHKHLGHSSDEVDERKMTKAEKSKEKRLKKKYDDSDMKASMKKQYGDDWESVYFATIRKRAMEAEVNEARWEFNPNKTYMVGDRLTWDDKYEFYLSPEDAEVLNKFMQQAENDDIRTKVWRVFWNSEETGDTAQGPVKAIAYAKKALGITEAKEKGMWAVEALGYSVNGERPDYWYKTGMTEAEARKRHAALSNSGKWAMVRIWDRSWGASPGEWEPANDTRMGTITVKTDAERKKRAQMYRDKKAKEESVENTLEGESQFDGHDIMSEDPPNGIDFDYANLSKVNWAQYSEEDIKTFYSIVDNLSFESGYYNDGEFDDSHFNALQWLEKNVMNKTEANAVKETLSPEEKRLVNQMYNKDGTLTDIGRQVMNHGKKKDSKKTDESTASGLTQSVMARAIEEMTSAGAIASVATPMGKMQRRKKTNESEMMTEAEFDEAAGEKDACYHKVKSRYKVWPSAYASGALAKCRKVGAKNWGKSKK